MRGFLEDGFGGQVMDGDLVAQQSQEPAGQAAHGDPVDAIFVDSGGNFDRDPVRQIGEQAVVGDVDGWFLVARIGQDAFDDGDDSFAEVQFDLRFYTGTGILYRSGRNRGYLCGRLHHTPIGCIRQNGCRW